MELSKSKPPVEEFYPLFPGQAIPSGPKKRTYKRVDHPIWSHNKARFIALYLKYFVQITKHGAYIDGFAGPQYADHLDAWTAARVLDSRPKWLRQFFLCEIKPKSLKELEKLVASQPPVTDSRGRTLKRTVTIHPGDST